VNARDDDDDGDDFNGDEVVDVDEENNDGNGLLTSQLLAEARRERAELRSAFSLLTSV